jgi:phosphoglycerol transferase MdoB-like AlkP superfamily enzyme
MTSLLSNRYVVFLLFLVFYTKLVELCGGLHGGVTFLGEYLEVLIVLYLYWYLSALLKPSRWRSVLAASPLLLAYFGQDIYYLMLGRVFRVVELTEVAELQKVTTYKYLITISVVGAVPLAGFIYYFDFRRWRTLIFGFLPLALATGIIGFFPASAVGIFNFIGRPVLNWSDEISAENNGRFAMLAFREAQRRFALTRTSVFFNRPKYDEEARDGANWLRTNGSGKNIHLVLMESFVDPTLFRGATFTKDPVHPEFRRLFGASQGFSVSPVFGGKTSQAEFELLCGEPAFQELAGVEFNSFSGTQAYCLPGTLALAGYRTVASNAFRPGFFNTIKAYTGIGFREKYFPKEYIDGIDTYLATGDTTGELYMFDGELFRQNLKFVKEALARENGPPLFNYVVSMFGHLPHVLNKEKRPYLLKLISDSHYTDPQLERVANQYYYRTQAVAEFVRQLMSMDRESLIIIVSDHVPPLQGFPTYRTFRYLDNCPNSIYLNRILVVKNGVVQSPVTIHHYDVPKLILDYLSQGQYCREHDCGFTRNVLLSDRESRHDDYMRLMAHAIQ